MSQRDKAILLVGLLLLSTSAFADCVGHASPGGPAKMCAGADDAIRDLIEARARKEVDAFAANPRHGRFEEVRELMAELLDAATARGELLSLKEAYAQACEIRDRIIYFQNKTTAPAPIRF